MSACFADRRTSFSDLERSLGIATAAEYLTDGYYGDSFSDLERSLGIATGRTCLTKPSR